MLLLGSKHTAQRCLNTIFMNSKNSKTSDLHKILLNLTEKINLKKEINLLFIKCWHIRYMEKYKKVI